MNKDFLIYDIKNSIKKPVNRIWTYLDGHGFNGIVDKMSVPANYAGRTVMDEKETNRFIYDRISQNLPLMVARYGAVELNYVYHYYKLQNGLTSHTKADSALNMLCFNAGFFPKSHKDAEKFVEMYISSSEEMDLCGVWGITMEEYVLSKYAVNCKLTKKRFIEPWLMEKDTPWTKALFDRRVLLVHPFAETMEKQYKHREELFSNRFGKDDILPPMEMKYLKAVQSIGGKGANGFSSWFDAYKYMLDEIIKTDFDVAVLGCGAYGFPLAAEIKRLGKQAIHLGGAAQIWFGIKGKRWEKELPVTSLYNDYWVRPSDEEKPKHADGVEGGCYW